MRSARRFERRVKRLGRDDEAWRNRKAGARHDFPTDRAGVGNIRGAGPPPRPA